MIESDIEAPSAIEAGGERREDLDQGAISRQTEPCALSCPQISAHKSRIVCPCSSATPETHQQYRPSDVPMHVHGGLLMLS